MSASENRVFISTVSDEFEKPTAPFPGLRGQLRHYLTAADCEVKVQEDFRQTPGGTVDKLDAYVRRCAAVIHLVGQKPGAIADVPDVADYLRAIESGPGGRKFLDNQPALRDALGDFSGLSYTQWEALMALHHCVPLFVYAAPNAAGQKSHLDRLLLASPKKYASRFTDAADLLGQLIGDLRYIVPAFGPAVQRIHPPKFLHHNAELFLGREEELAMLDRAWADDVNVLSLVAWGGVGKTALIVEWVQTRFIDRGWKNTEGRPDPLVYFDWSFYDQGTRQIGGESARTGNVGDFFEQALTWFGDADPNLPGKGTRLAGLVQQQRSLLILDGLEPLQQPLGHPQAGRLLDPDLADLLCALAAHNPGLSLLTSRQIIADLDGIRGRSQHKDLDELPKAVAVSLLQRLQVTGTEAELAKAAEDFDCHALSLTLLGRFLVDAHGGDIRHIDEVKLHEADDATRPERHRTAWKVLSSYNEWLATAQTQPETLAVLRLLGLFDRPATADCLNVLRKGEVIPGLTNPLHSLTDARWSILLKRLECAHLLKLRDADTNPQSATQNPPSVDAHPLVRGYFAEQLRSTQPEAWRAAHSRLFDHLCASTEHRPATLVGLQPLYQAVTHGCLAGRQHETCDRVYIDRILRGTDLDGFYSTNKLGAMGADLGAVAAFFNQPWTQLSPNLSTPAQAWLLNQAALRLRALGRLTDALEPMRVTLNINEEAEQWDNAAVVASNLSELEESLGRLSDAVADSHRAIAFADRTGDLFQLMTKRARAADILHQTGQREKAQTLFIEAEILQAEMQPKFPLLYSVQGFLYVDLLMTLAEHSAWKAVLSFSFPRWSSSEKQNSAYDPSTHPTSAEAISALAACAEAARRAELAIYRNTYDLNTPLLTIALDHLTLGRASLYQALIGTDLPIFPINSDLRTQVLIALTTLREANNLDHLPKALLTAALYAGTLGGDLAQARRYLDEAQQIAERGPMPLYLADVHLHRARLFASGSFPDIDPLAELAEARKLIGRHGYGRRLEELADAEAALGVC